MKLFSSTESYKLYHGNMLDMLDVIEPNSIDAIVTDPPYELSFMNKGWDNSGIAFQKETWEKCLKVLKPGGYLLSFGGSRTFHRIACAIEDAGFEIRDTIMYLYGSGFPKSLNIGLAIDKKNGVDNRTGNIVSGMASNNTLSMRNGVSESMEFASEYSERKAQNEWAGWGTALKPAYEPILVSRKPCEGSCVDNVMKYGVGGINIDECRVGVEERTYKGAGASPQKIDNHEKGDTGIGMLDGSGKDLEFTVTGRFPANVILTYDETDYDEVCGGMPESKGASSQNNYSNGHIYRGQSLQESSTSLTGYREWYNDNGSASRYFYCAKASKRDRDEGLPEGKHNIHPTVKNTALMQYLIRLVTPKGGTILDPFNGSGSTGKAAMYENKDRNAGYKYIGIELTPEYLPIADARIRFALGDNTPVEYSEVVSNKTTPKSVNSSGQISLFDGNT